MKQCGSKEMVFLRFSEQKRFFKKPNMEKCVAEKKLTKEKKTRTKLSERD